MATVNPDPKRDTIFGVIIGLPLGEGKIIFGCITCPWHGYQYVPATGASPPPFREQVPTFNVRVKNGRVWIDPNPNPAGSRAEPALIET